MPTTQPRTGRPAGRHIESRAQRAASLCARRRLHDAARRAGVVFLLGAAFGVAAAYPLKAKAEPYGSIVTVPATLQAEHYDTGGEGVAYHDATPANMGGRYRSDGVDIALAGTATVVNSFQAGEWMNYTINVSAAGSYDIALLAATAYTGASFHIEIDGRDVTGPVAVPSTGGWATFQWVGRKGVALTGGRHVLKVFSNGDFFSVDQIRVSRSVAAATPVPGTGTATPGSGTASAPSTPFSGAPVTVPATWQAEHYDRGGQAIAYHDLDAGRPESEYRTNERVDVIQSTSNGPVVNNFQNGEWLAYTITVPRAGRYDIGVHASSAMTGGAFRATINGRDVTGAVGVPNTGGWDNFRWVTKRGVTLNAGRQVLKIHAVRQYFNLNAIRILRPAASPTTSGATGARQFFCTFSQSPSDCGFYVQQKAAGRATIVGIGRDGGTAVRLRTLPGDNNVAGSGPDNERTDLSLSTGATDCSQGMEAWWAHSVLFPSDYTDPVNGYGVVMDFHHTGSTGQANFHLDSSRWDGRLHLRGYGGASVDGGHYEVVLGPVVKNVWYDFVYHVRWSSGSDGFMRAWMNGKRVLDHRGPTLYAGQQCYLKLANYHSAFGQPSSIIHDRVIRGTTPAAVARTPLEGVSN